ncbi:hypothetical protein R1flu_004780 [Riccia fluitans]|uniref:Uncharacterized protein n=1 Tax=Riccia fluitans TaxID=41844 RepID=A0ABD1YR93_9MARC
MLSDVDSEETEFSANPVYHRREPVVRSDLLSFAPREWMVRYPTSPHASRQGSISHSPPYAVTRAETSSKLHVTILARARGLQTFVYRGLPFRRCHFSRSGPAFLDDALFWCEEHIG